MIVPRSVGVHAVEDRQHAQAALNHGHGVIGGDVSEHHLLDRVGIDGAPAERPHRLSGDPNLIREKEPTRSERPRRGAVAVDDVPQRHDGEVGGDLGGLLDQRRLHPLILKAVPRRAEGGTGGPPSGDLAGGDRVDVPLADASAIFRDDVPVLPRFRQEIAQLDAEQVVPDLVVEEPPSLCGDLTQFLDGHRLHLLVVLQSTRQSTVVVDGDRLEVSRCGDGGIRMHRDRQVDTP